MQIQSFWLAGSALCLVLALIWLIQFAVHRLRGRPSLANWLPANREQRLRVVQAIAVDARRRVLLLACDDREVWVLTGGPNDVLLGALTREIAP